MTDESAVNPNARQQRLQRLRVCLKLMLLLSFMVIAWVLASSGTSMDSAKQSLPELKVDISDLKPGQSKTILWSERPIIIVHRTASQQHQLEVENNALADPKSLKSRQPGFATNAHRSLHPTWFVAIALGTDLNCVVDIAEVPPKEPSIEGWQGGFTDSCRGSHYDLAGRVFSRQYATENLAIPPYTMAESTLILGQ